MVPPFTIAARGDARRDSDGPSRAKLPCGQRVFALPRAGWSRGVVEGYRRRLEPITGPLLKTMRLVENFLRPLTILEFTSSDAASYANLRAKLERAGKPIGPFDTLIAAQALGQKLILVSNNEREFGRVSGLRLENWARV